MTPPHSFNVGSAQITKVHETDLNGFALHQLLPAINPQVLAAHPEWIPSGTVDAEGRALLSVHSWLVRYGGRTILIDTGVGDDKPRPQQPALNRLHTTFIERLAEAEVHPDEVDLILLTHIHSDHVGWNTRLVGETWEPTFRNAEVVCSDLEWRYGAALTDGDVTAIAECREEAGMGDPVRIPVAGTFADSMRPLEGRSRIRRMAVDGTEIADGLRFVSTPGHSIDHASIELTSQGEVALFSGDVFHHPVEVPSADLVSVFCEFPERTRSSRKLFMANASSKDALVFTSHFPRTSVGRIHRAEGGFAWQFLGSDAAA